MLVARRDLARAQLEGRKPGEAGLESGIGERVRRELGLEPGVERLLAPSRELLGLARARAIAQAQQEVAGASLEGHDKDCRARWREAQSCSRPGLRPRTRSSRRSGKARPTRRRSTSTSREPGGRP